MRDIAFIVYPGYSVMALTIAMAFEVANSVTESQPYDLHFVSEAGGPVRTSAGMMIESEAFSDTPFDTLVVGGATTPIAATAGLLEFVRAASSRHRRIAAVFTGAFVLAEAGLLDGRRAATHWLHADELQRRFPKVKIAHDRIFMNDGPIWTTAGGAAGLDLGLTLIEMDLGAELVKSVARELVIYHRRSGEQSQFSALLDLSPKSDRIQMALSYARENLHKPLTVEELAEVACLSPRHFSRTFHAETGQSPAKAIENMRVESARSLMEQSRHPMDVVAHQTGFCDRDRMRRAFLRAFGQSPQVLRRLARQEAIA
ncbi:GlxA family transcriptional regulator [Luteibacter pinisoli]|uniref:GlxA family transcriptional regulator n=1 Tax=Luteibacter pinisoli TaxID=2589080 RepID=A0A4Y5Z3L0_9GAMM|nr:GlxA family transcriptional regulator [Luteibacter pinisoli]QDE39496.1 GlxA family transcriptional regulator [Luteibacter pinisoli]